LFLLAAVAGSPVITVGILEWGFPFLAGATIMAWTVEAVYENGVLKPKEPLPLAEHEQVRITIQTAPNWVEATAGICGWKGSAEEAERFATDPELDFPPPPEEP
jgi:predicted DNA-binding antitoxin AbrB/MazE fold protein